LFWLGLLGVVQGHWPEFVQGRATEHAVYVLRERIAVEVQVWISPNQPPIILVICVDSNVACARIENIPMRSVNPETLSSLAARAPVQATASTTSV